MEKEIQWVYKCLLNAVRAVIGSQRHSSGSTSAVSLQDSPFVSLLDLLWPLLGPSQWAVTFLEERAEEVWQVALHSGQK